MAQKIGKALVVGAGISGMRAALDLAESGYGVTLIDRASHMGGILSGLDHQFPNDGCGMCKLLPHVDRDSDAQRCLRKGLSHENIDIRLQTELMELSGEAGNFRATLKTIPNPVDPALCIGCGHCTPVCPVEIPDPFNAGTGKRKAIDLPSPHMAPGPYQIDIEACTQCGECRKVCPTNAIAMPAEDRRTFFILVVDDEQIIRDSLKEWLAIEGGFHVITAESGEKALEILAEQSIDLMLVDIKMPDMDGITVLEQARALSPELSVMMITAYATVDTAVEAMKLGAVDYLIKPFDPEALLPKIVEMYHDMRLPPGPEIHVGAIVIAGGTDFYDPAANKNPFGYRELPDVLTSRAFERQISGTGPTGGKLARPSDGQPVRRIAFIQCVGSRDIQADADFCSSVCCMYAIKQARLAKKLAAEHGETVETVIYHMDLRTFGKPYQQYRDAAEAEGVRFVRGRIHTISADTKSDDLYIRAVDMSGHIQNKHFDMAVLATGQRPSAKIGELADMLRIEQNPWGFIETEAFSPTQTTQKGILAAGACTGLKDIHDSVICGSAAALHASRTIHAAGGGISDESAPEAAYADVSRQPADVFVAICDCHQAISRVMDPAAVSEKLTADPAVSRVETVDDLCRQDGFSDLAEKIGRARPNRVLIAACRPLMARQNIQKLASAVSLSPDLIEAVDIRKGVADLPEQPNAPESAAPKNAATVATDITQRLEMAAARLKGVDPGFVAFSEIQQSALVVGGGIAGMTAALGIADHGFAVHLIEKSDRLGGNLNWLHRTIDGQSVGELLDRTVSRVENHPLVTVYKNADIIDAGGRTGDFHTLVQAPEGEPVKIDHGTVILATGGGAADTDAYTYGSDSRICNQKEFETQLHDNTFDAAGVSRVVMIQCAGTRKPPKNYCSRVCCATTLKHALTIKEKNPDAEIYVFYRDMMAYGFLESYFTKARKAGVIFIPYTPDAPPAVSASDEAVYVSGYEPVIDCEIEIASDLVVLATGMVPEMPEPLLAGFAAEADEHGFFREAEYKWRPVESLGQGVFACGIALSPKSIGESIASAEAAAGRALRIMTRRQLPAGKIVARVRHSLCTLCLACVAACPYGARVFDPELEQIAVNAAACQACGACAAACPNFASYVEGYAPDQMMAMIDAVV